MAEAVMVTNGITAVVTVIVMELEYAAALPAQLPYGCMATLTTSPFFNEAV